MRSNKAKYYLTSEELYVEWCKWRDSADAIADRTITIKLAQQIEEVATRLSFSRSFINYPEDMKEDMISNAILKCFKNLKNMKEDKKDAFFNYITRCCWCSFLTTIGKHYKQLNIKRDLAEIYLANFNEQYGTTFINENTKQYRREQEKT